MGPAPPLESAEGRPSNRTIAATYDRLSWLYANVIAPFETSVQTRAIAQLSPQPGDRALEIGCGPGHTLPILAQWVGADGAVVGVDAAPGMVRTAQRRLRRGRPAASVDIVLGDGRRLPLLAKAVDVAYIAETLELFSPEDAKTLLAELRRVLRPDGRLCVVSMNRRGHETSPFVRIYEWLFEHVPGFRRTGCRPIDVVGVVEAGGFTVETARDVVRWGGWPTAIVVATPT